MLRIVILILILRIVIVRTLGFAALLPAMVTGDVPDAARDAYT